MIIGKIICATCGKDCTPPNHMYGFIMQKRTTITPGQAADLKAVAEELGQDEFVFCWSCTAKAFGVKPLVKKEQEKTKSKNSMLEPSLTGD